MITPDYVRTMARYNAWQNQNLLEAAATLDAAALQADRGAFFGSIEETFNHILWDDTVWMSRFEAGPRPEVGFQGSRTFTDGWEAFLAERQTMDGRLQAWADTRSQAQLDGILSFHSVAAGAEITKPVAICVTHLFNHQTHHRGQIHAMLTAAGARPGDTDLFIMTGVD